MRGYSGGDTIWTIIEDWNFGYHTNLWCILVLSSIRSQYIACSYGTIKTCLQSFLTCNFFSSEVCKKLFYCICFLLYFMWYSIKEIYSFFASHMHLIHSSFCAVLIEKVSRDVNDRFSSSIHREEIRFWYLFVIIYFSEQCSFKII